MTDHARLANALDGLIHAETQVTTRGVDLTVAAVSDHDGPGGVDFGGGELEAAGTSRREPSLRSAGDDYGWWHLDAGGYLIEYNERLADDVEAVVQPRAAVVQRGASHPTLVVDSLDPVPLFVADGGLRLKENARVSTLRPWPG